MQQGHVACMPAAHTAASYSLVCLPAQVLVVSDVSAGAHISVYKHMHSRSCAWAADS
jgi:hypothetical protein